EKTVAVSYKKETKIDIPLGEEDGSCLITSVPIGADAYIENVLKGKTPLSLKPISSGSHTVKLSRSGYADTTAQIIIKPNQNTYYSVVLQEYTGPPAVSKAELKPGKKEISWGKDNSVMVYIPAGEFLMGSPEGEGENDEHPRHKVYLDAYYIDKYEVTNQQFAKFLNEWGKDADENGQKMIYEHDWGIKKVAAGFQPAKGYENYPVINVTWYGAAQYAKWAGKRLPTEAEWEKACRASSATAYYFGNNESGLGEYAWYSANSGSKTHPAGDRKPNAYGIYDMHGNVWEWCADWYDQNYYAKGIPGDKNSPNTNPQGPSTGSYRVIRGGSWFLDAVYCRSADRDWINPGYWWIIIGFRCAALRSER
ncbi:hypothetical protein COY52_04900, partial [Candidatus Desantisbacteria bacterium CG_4_10_14_0_8_um_filter_48_22]